MCLCLYALDVCVLCCVVCVHVRVPVLLSFQLVHDTSNTRSVVQHAQWLATTWTKLHDHVPWFVYKAVSVKKDTFDNTRTDRAFVRRSAQVSKTIANGEHTLNLSFAVPKLLELSLHRFSTWLLIFFSSKQILSSKWYSRKHGIQFLQWS